MILSKEFITKERHIWHEHFTPSIIAAAVVAAVMAFMKLTISNVILFSSIAASAFILTHSKSHHLIKLRTTLIAYIIAMITSGLLFVLNNILPIHQSIRLFLAIFLTGIIMYLANAVHPPAVSASLSFILLETTYFSGVLSLFIAILILLILVRLFTYIFSQHLPLRNFFKEFMIHK